MKLYSLCYRHRDSAGPRSVNNRPVERPSASFLIPVFFAQLFDVFQMSGWGLATRPFVNSFIFSLRGNFLQWYSHPDNSERKGKEPLLPRSVDSITALLNSSPSCHYGLFIYFWLNYTLTVPYHLYLYRKTHTHLLLDWIKYDITKEQLAILRKRDVCARIVFSTPRPASL